MDNMIEWLRKAKSMNNRGMADGAINRFVFYGFGCELFICVIFIFQSENGLKIEWAIKIRFLSTIFVPL